MTTLLENQTQLSKEKQAAEAAYQKGLEEQPDKCGTDFLEEFKKCQVLLIDQGRDTTEKPWFAEVINNKMIRFHGCYGRDSKFDKVLMVGDQAIYDSYNLKYLGRIVKITQKTVSFDTGNGSIKRLKLYDFISRNQNFTLAATYKHNNEEMNCI